MAQMKQTILTKELKLAPAPKAMPMWTVSFMHCNDDPKRFEANTYDIASFHNKKQVDVFLRRKLFEWMDGEMQFDDMDKQERDDFIHGRLSTKEMENIVKKCAESEFSVSPSFSWEVESTLYYPEAHPHYALNEHEDYSSEVTVDSDMESED